MAKINPCFKWTFIFFNSLFAIFGVVVFILGVILQQYIEEVHSLYAVITLYVVGSVIFIFAVLGAFGAYKENKCALIVFFVLMCLATAGTLRAAIPVADSHNRVISVVTEYLKQELPLTKDMEKPLNPIQIHFRCCGLFNGYTDWKDEVPESCACTDEYDESDTCVRITQRNTYQGFFVNRVEKVEKVWSKSCGPLMIEYLKKVLIIMMAVCFSLAALAILGGLMSLVMIIRITSPVNTEILPSLALSYQPPKYSEVVNY